VESGKPAPDVVGQPLEDAIASPSAVKPAAGQAMDCSAGGVALSEQAAKEQKDIRAARWVSVASLAASLIVGALGLTIGVMEASLSLVGFGGEAFLDGISSALVLWRFKKPKVRSFEDEEAAQAAKEARDRLRERNSGIGIGGIFIFTAIALLSSATHKAATFDADKHKEEERTAMIWGHILAWPSVFIFGTLAVVKYRLSKALHSKVLEKDALCSLLGAVLSMIVAGAAVMEQAMDSNPTASMVIDVAAGAGIALILGVEGARMLVHNLSGAALRETPNDKAGLTEANAI